MSIYLLAADTAARLRPAADHAELGLHDVAVAAVAPPAAPGAPPATQDGKAVQNALTAITKFIPAEAVTLYLAVVGIIAGWKIPADLRVWFACGAAFAIIYYTVTTLIDAGRQKTPFRITVLFVWRLVALLVAFIVWGFAVSSDTVEAFFGDPTRAPHVHDFVSIMVLVTSPLLSLFDNLVQAYAPQSDKAA